MYRTPVLAFPRDDGYLISLTYGQNVDWLKNVVAAGGCTLEHGGRAVALVDPVMLDGEDAVAGVPGGVRWVLRRLNVTKAVRLRRADATGSVSGASGA